MFFHGPSTLLNFKELKDLPSKNENDHKKHIF
jgi:hypothetical protein